MKVICHRSYETSTFNDLKLENGRNSNGIIKLELNISSKFLICAVTSNTSNKFSMSIILLTDA